MFWTLFGFTKVFIRIFQNRVGLEFEHWLPRFAERALTFLCASVAREVFKRWVPCFFGKWPYAFDEASLKACCGIGFRCRGSKWLKLGIKHVSNPGNHNIEDMSVFGKRNMLVY